MLRWDEITVRTEKTWDQLLQAGKSISPTKLAEVDASVDPHSTVNFQFTSGTTGSPKATMLSHL